MNKMYAVVTGISPGDVAREMDRFAKDGWLMCSFQALSTSGGIVFVAVMSIDRDKA